MKYGIASIITFMFFFSCLGFAQDNNSTIAIVPAYTKIGVESWSAGGTGIVQPGTNTAAINNPAGMSFDGLTASLEFGKNFYTLDNMEVSLKNIFLFPEYASIGMSYDNMNFAIGYENSYNYHMSSRLIEATDSSYASYNFDSHLIEHSFFASGNIREGQLQYGLTLGLNYLTDDEETMNLKASNHGFGMLAIGGILYQPDDKECAGLTFRYNTPISYDLTYLTEKYSYKAKSPWIMEAGYSILFTPTLKALGSVEFQDWMDVTSNVRNRVQYHVGLECNISKTDELSVGFFTQLDPNTRIDDIYPKFFLTAGYQDIIGNVKVGVSLLDNHIFSLTSDTYGTVGNLHQTILSLGANYEFK